MKATAELIVHTAAVHGREGGCHHVQRLRVAGALPVAQQEVENRWTGKLWSIAEASEARIKRAPEMVEGTLRKRGFHMTRSGGWPVGLGPEMVHDVLAGFQNLRALAGPCLGDTLQYCRESGSAITVVGGKVSTAHERLEVGCEPDGHGPATPTGGGLHVSHVDAVDIGTLFAVHLDADKPLVHQLRNFRVFERLPLHYVAPVAGGVADGKKDRFIFGAGPGEGFFTPWKPIDGVVSVLQKVRALFEREAVGGH